jgi:hypothetical protein
MKKIIIALSLVLAISTAATADPTEKILKIFNETFSTVKDVKWYEDAKEYLVCFYQNDVYTKVTYDKEGAFVSSLRYYKETDLPLNVLSAIKNKYADKKIFGVTESTDANGVLYYVKIEDAKNWYTLKATTDASLEVTEKFKKQ